MSRPLTLSIDAMGGDHAPGAIIEGCAIARVRHPKVHFLLHGLSGALRPLVDQHTILGDCTSIVAAETMVAMDDKPSQALRRGRGTSMWRAIDALRQGEADVAVSAGNTGALMAMAKFQLKTLPNVARPAIVALWPTTRGQSIVLDVGANIGASCEQLVDFAIMGAAFARVTLGLARPSVGLLNIGTEEIKGNEAVKLAAQTLRAAGDLSFDFHGYVEGDDISTGVVDVVVTDGFTGNVALKAAEGTARLVGTYLRQALTNSLFSKAGAALASGALRVLRTKMDPRSVNGGVFLGLNGIVVKSHGGTDGLGFASAIDLAVDMGKSDLQARIAHDVAQIAPMLPGGSDALAVGGDPVTVAP
ncbi:MAG: phosphate acyltransferase PlsX [Alphaproteobacteria bacterium]|nr:phosphate acyltransferase PlsX [Alphaproteobacteria bacterium]